MLLTLYTVHCTVYTVQCQQHNFIYFFLVSKINCPPASTPVGFEFLELKYFLMILKLIFITIYRPQMKYIVPSVVQVVPAQVSTGAA